MSLGGPIVDFLIEQLLQRASDTVWKRATGWLSGDPFSTDLDQALAASLERALADGLGEASAAPIDRAKEILLGQGPVEFDVDSLTVDVPIAFTLASLIAGLVATAQRPFDVADTDLGSAWSHLEAEMGRLLDPAQLQQRWFDELGAEISANRIRGGALTALAAHLDAERSRIEFAAMIDVVARIHADLEGMSGLALALGEAARAFDRSPQPAPDAAPIDQVRVALQERTERLLEQNPLIPQVRIVRRLKTGKTLAESLQSSDEPIVLLAGPGEGKSVALADAATTLTETGNGLAFALHYNEALVLPRAPSTAEFARAVADGVFPFDSSLASGLRAILTDQTCTLLVDGVDEVDPDGTARGHRRRFLAGLSLWSKNPGNTFVIAGRALDTPTGRPTTSATFAPLLHEDVRAIIAARLGDGRAEEAERRLERGQFRESLLLINLFAMSMAIEPAGEFDPLSYSQLATVVPRVVDLLVQGTWRTDSLSNDERWSDDLLALAATAAWRLGDGRPVSTFTHRQLVVALAEDRAAARQLEDRSNLIVGPPNAMRFLHRRLADHLLALHAVDHVDDLRRVVSERFWEHSTKYLLHDVAAIATDRTEILDMAIAERSRHSPAFDLGLDYCAAISSIGPIEDRHEEQQSIRMDSYDVIAARPIETSGHNAMWKPYLLEFAKFVDESGTNLHGRSPSEPIEPAVAEMLRSKGMVDSTEAVEAAVREVRTWLAHRRNGGIGRPIGIRDSFAPTGSVIMPHPDSEKEQFVTLWRGTAQTNNWLDGKPSLGWLFCHDDPRACPLEEEDNCSGGWTNVYETSMFKPFGLRCAWVSAMARDRDFVETYLGPRQLGAIVRAPKFEWSRAHAAARYAVAFGEIAAPDFEWWWRQSDTTDVERAWVVATLHDKIKFDSVGRMLARLDGSLESDIGSIGSHFDPRPPSLISGRWNRYWQERAR